MDTTNSLLPELGGHAKGNLPYAKKGPVHCISVVFVMTKLLANAKEQNKARNPFILVVRVPKNL